MDEISPPNSARGALYVVATPIGNLEDITLRALRILREADVIACEDTRHTQKLLNHYEIKKKLVSYHEHNEVTRSGELVTEMLRGAKIALVSDAGTPVISDPGFGVVSAAIAAGIAVIPIPGASALAGSIAAAGLPSESVWFLGFLPSRTSARRKALRSIAGLKYSDDLTAPTLAFYEAPHRVVGMLADCSEILGDRKAVIARELTKIHEQFLRGTLAELARETLAHPLKGEITILIGPEDTRNHPSASEAQPQAAAVSISARVKSVMREQNVSEKEALKIAARELGIPRREAYKRLVEEKR